MKDLKHQLIDQLEDADILEEFKRRKLHHFEIPEKEKTSDGAVLFFFFLQIIIVILTYFLAYEL